MLWKGNLEQYEKTIEKHIRKENPAVERQSRKGVSRLI